MSKIRTIIVNDNQIDSAQIISRTDDYLQTCLEELAECVEIGKKKKVDFMLLGGDLFNRREPSGRCRNQTLSILQGFDKDIIGCPGNHDTGNELSNLNITALGTLIIAGVVRFQPHYPEYSLATLAHDSDVMSLIRNGELKRYPVRMWSLHTSIATMPIRGDYILFNELDVNPECSVVTSGHIHIPMEKRRDDGVIFVNPGSVGRPSASEDNIGHEPRVAIVEYDTESRDSSVEYIVLRSSKPAREIFNLEEQDRRKMALEGSKDFVRKLHATMTFNRGFDKYEALRQDAKEAKLADDVLQMALDAIREASEAKKREIE